MQPQESEQCWVGCVLAIVSSHRITNYNVIYVPFFHSLIVKTIFVKRKWISAMTKNQKLFSGFAELLALAFARTLHLAGCPLSGLTPARWGMMMAQSSGDPFNMKKLNWCS